MVIEQDRAEHAALSFKTLRKWSFESGTGSHVVRSIFALFCPSAALLARAGRGCTERRDYTIAEIGVCGIRFELCKTAAALWPPRRWRIKLPC
jgi:hypothetical protein